MGQNHNLRYLWDLSPLFSAFVQRIELLKVSSHDLSFILSHMLGDYTLLMAAMFKLPLSLLAIQHGSPLFLCPKTTKSMHCFCFLLTVVLENPTISISFCTSTYWKSLLVTLCPSHPPKLFHWLRHAGF